MLDKRVPQCATSSCRARVSFEKHLGSIGYILTTTEVADAVWCIDRLARLGSQGVWCELTGYVQFCDRGSAAITGHTGGGQYTASNW